MGQTLGEPITRKETASCTDSNYKVGSSCMQGWRINMEDSHTHILSLPNDSNAAFFAVYDGHGGDKVSQYASMHLHKRITNDPSYTEGNIEDALRHGFLNLDVQMLDDKETKEEMSGTTAATILIKNSTIYCANVGDSRAVASVNGQALALSYDHKPCNESEKARIVAAGGWVEFNRVNGNLALSRALGDFGFKQNDQMSAEEQIVTANPEILKFKITNEFEFLVLACDGIWDVMSNQEVVNFCRNGFLKGKAPELVCEELLDKCLAPDCELSGIGCDNMTVVLVVLLQGDTFDAFRMRLHNEPDVVETVSSEELKRFDDLAKHKEFYESNNNMKAAELASAAVTIKSSDEPCVLDELFSTPSGSPNPDFCVPEKVTPHSLKMTISDSKNNDCSTTGSTTNAKVDLITVDSKNDDSNCGDSRMNAIPKIPVSTTIVDPIFTSSNMTN